MAVAGETREHLAPGQIEFDQPVYGILVVGNRSAVMLPSLYTKYDVAKAFADTIPDSYYVVQLTSPGFGQ